MGRSDFPPPAGYARISEHMDLPRQRKLPVGKLLLGVIFAGIVLVVLAALFQDREWTVPEEAKQVRNPILPSEAARRAAAVIYRDKCANCHGETGKGDGAEGRMHSPAPQNFTDAARMNAVSDGELFYKITQGRRPMPSFRNKLTEEQRWQLILLIRGFARDSRGTPEPPGRQAAPEK